MFLARLISRRPKIRSVEHRPSGMPGFDRDFYLTQNPDVAASGTDPLGHYLEHGWREGREPSAGFSGQRYLVLNPDVQASGINPLVHYLERGLAEGRAGAGPAAPAPAPASLELQPASAPVVVAQIEGHVGCGNGPTRLL